jgi:hypothetical protein
MRDVVDFEITNHGAVKGNGEFIGREFDSLRSGNGPLVAHSLSRIRSRPTIGTVLDLVTQSGNFTFATNLYTPTQLAALLDPIRALIQTSGSTSAIHASVSGVAESAGGPSGNLEHRTPVQSRAMIGAALPSEDGARTPGNRAGGAGVGSTAEDADKQLAEQLEQLTELHRTRVVSERDFEVARARLLESWVRHHP